MSKGSKQRPTDLQRFGDNYDAIFGKKKKPISKLPDPTGFWECLSSDSFKEMIESDAKDQRQGNDPSIQQC